MTTSCSSSGYGRPRDLHSFPTRRSSDLEELARLVVENKRLHEAELQAHVQEDQPDQEEVIAAHGFASQGCGRRASGDRKSTRLNSSHVRISYAVFRLKKKKTVRRPPPEP